MHLLPIGQFAQASGLSVTALRHYDASGLLAPAFVDPDSGYRYFRRDQVRTAQLIRALRQLDIPIEDVRCLLARHQDGEDLAPDLHTHLKAAEYRLEVQRSVLHALLTRLDGGAEMNHRVMVRQSDPLRVLVCSATLRQAGLDEFTRTSFQAMYTIAGQGPLTFTEPGFIRLHGVCDEENEALVDACLPFWQEGAQPGGLPEGMSVLDIPEAACVTTVVKGAAAVFPEIHTAYDAVAGWVTEHGFSFAGPVREIFLRWTGTPGHPENVTEIAWPIEEAMAPSPQPGMWPSVALR